MEDRIKTLMQENGLTVDVILHIPTILAGATVPDLMGEFFDLDATSNDTFEHFKGRWPGYEAMVAEHDFDFTEVDQRKIIEQCPMDFLARIQWRTKVFSIKDGKATATRWTPSRAGSNGWFLGESLEDCIEQAAQVAAAYHQAHESSAIASGHDSDFEEDDDVLNDEEDDDEDEETDVDDGEDLDD